MQSHSSQDDSFKQPTSQIMHDEPLQDSEDTAPKSPARSSASVPQALAGTIMFLK